MLGGHSIFEIATCLKQSQVQQLIPKVWGISNNCNHLSFVVLELDWDVLVFDDLRKLYPFKH